MRAALKHNAVRKVPCTCRSGVRCTFPWKRPTTTQRTRTVDELVPVSQSYGEEHVAIVGVAFGMAIMALSLRML